MSTIRTFALLLPFALLQLNGRFAFSACDDGQQNIVKLADASANNIIQVTDGVAYTENEKNQPSCYKNQANILLPGIVKLVSGTITVGKKLNFAGNTKALLTLKKNSMLIGTVCQDGKSKNFLVPDEDCYFDICAASKSLCDTLATPGVHKLGELEGDVGVNSTLVLPPVSSALKPLLKGQWKVEIKLQVGDQVVAYVRMPASGDWVYLDQ